MQANTSERVFQNDIIVAIEVDAKQYLIGRTPSTNTVDKDIQQLPEEKLTENKPFSSYCKHCDLNFDDVIEYEHHNLTMHGQKKILSCAICNTTFKRSDHLKRHVHSMHTNEKLYYCPVCKKNCKSRDILLKHVQNKHSGHEEVIRCRECSFQCHHISNLLKHETKHLSVKHMCTFCHMYFKRRDHMLRHIKSQHLNESVICPLCGQSYKRKDHVTRHVREKHKMILINGKLIKSSDFIESAESAL